jgi:hypothetical protein
MSAYDPKRTFHPRNFPLGATIALKATGKAREPTAHLVTCAKLGAAGAFSTENTKLIEESGGTRADHDQTIRPGFQGSV